MRVIALLVLLGQAAAPISDNVWANPKTKVLRPMYVYPDDALSHKIADKTATLADVQELFANSKGEEYRDAFYRSPEATALMTDGLTHLFHAFHQLIVSKKDGVTNYWFLLERGNQGCMDVLSHFSDGPGGSDLKTADALIGTNHIGGVISFGVARMCP